MEGYGMNVTEVSGEEAVRILLDALIGQPEEYLDNSDRVVEDIDRQMHYLISVNLLQPQEYVNITDNNNSAQERGKEMIEKHLQTKTHVDKGEEESDVCSICLDGFQEGYSVGFLDCGHEFHCSCVKNWLAINNVCPLCKSTGVRYG